MVLACKAILPETNQESWKSREGRFIYASKKEAGSEIFQESHFQRAGSSCMSLVWPPPCNSDHQDYYMFSRGFLLTFTFHCYREGAISYVYVTFFNRYTLPETNIAPARKPSQKETIVFQPSIFRCYVSFREDILSHCIPKYLQRFFPFWFSALAFGVCLR